MHEAKSYKTAGAFRAALENRLQMRARDEKTDLQRLRRQVAFDRFLARIFLKGPKADYPWLFRSGYAMELRIQFARATKDLDLTLHDGTRLSNDQRNVGKKCGRCCKKQYERALTTSLNSLWGSARRTGWRARGRQSLSDPSTNGRAGFRSLQIRSLCHLIRLLCF
jgi:hypothetical protein